MKLKVDSGKRSFGYRTQMTIHSQLSTFILFRFSILNSRLFRILSLLICLLCPIGAWAQEPTLPNIPPEAEYPFKRDIEKGKYDKAEEKIKRRIVRDTANLECHYAAYRLYCTTDFVRRNLDTAYWHLVRVRQLYAQADEKNLERWARDSYSGARIDYDLYLLGELALADCAAIRTPDAYQHYLDYYTLLPHHLRDSATNSRDSLEFDIARRSGSVETIQDFIDRRPKALVRGDAIVLRDSLAFAIADAQHTYTAYQHFRVTYPNSHLYSRATDSVYTLDYRDVLHHNSEQYYRGYAERYPSSPYANRCLWLADSIEYHREVDTTDWQSIVQYLDSRNRPQWRDTATLCLTLYALQHGNVKAAQQAALRTSVDAPMRIELGKMLYSAYMNTSILNYNLFYSSFRNLVSDEQRRADSLGHLYYLNRDQYEIDSCILHIAPSHEAYQLLQQLIKDDLDHHRWKAALATANRYAYTFALGIDYDFHQLVATLEQRISADNNNLKKHPRLKIHSSQDGTLSQSDFFYLSIPNFQLPVYDTMTTNGGQIMLFTAYDENDNYAVKGSLNIYVTLLDSTGVWTSPIELGSVVNTPYDERSPYLLPDLRTLYFSSQGHGSLGGLDIFVTTRLDDSWIHWSRPVNVSKEINTTDDEWIEAR